MNYIIKRFSIKLFNMIVCNISTIYLVNFSGEKKAIYLLKVNFYSYEILVNVSFDRKKKGVKSL